MTHQTHSSSFSLDITMSHPFFLLKKNQCHVLVLLLMVISMQLSPCSLLELWVYELLFLEFQTCCWFEYLCLLCLRSRTASNWQSVPFALCLSSKRFESVTQSDFLGPSQTVPSNSRCASLHCRSLYISFCLKAIMLMGILLAIVMWICFWLPLTTQRSLLCWNWWLSSAYY